VPWLLLATLVTYLTPWLFPDPPLAFYVMRGWLGVCYVWAMWRGIRPSVPVLIMLGTFEASSAICGSMFAALAPAREGLCDAGTGLPTYLLFLTGSAIAAVSTIRPNR
jgi:hypothetical protein